MKRDAIIKTIAGLVGQPHKVDLKNYDLLVIVEIYQVGILQRHTRERPLHCVC